MDSESFQGSDPWKYHPFQLGECENLENYEPGGFHPVHLGDAYDEDRYLIVHKLGFGGFSTVWLARDALDGRWVALKIVAASDSPTYEARSAIANHPSIIGCRLFALPERKFWIDGPNGRHLCLVLTVLGHDLSSLSREIYARVSPGFAREVSLQAAQALVHLHSNGLVHGDLTTRNIALRLTEDFSTLTEEDLLRIFGQPQTSPILTYSGQPLWRHAPKYNVVPLDFRLATTNLLSREICIIDFDQSFDATSGPPSEPPGIPARYMAPEVAVGKPTGLASDIWALGCAIFRIRSGHDLFFDYDTSCPADALRQIIKVMGDLPQEWAGTKFDEDGFAVAPNEEGEPFWSLRERDSLENRVRRIIDEPASLSINTPGGYGNAPVDSTNEANSTDKDDGWKYDEFDVELRVPYAPGLGSMVWRPTAVCVDGGYFIGYDEAGRTMEMLETFPKIEGPEVALLVDLLSKIFRYHPAKRLTAVEVVAHPWFHCGG